MAISLLFLGVALLALTAWIFSDKFGASQGGDTVLQSESNQEIIKEILVDVSDSFAHTGW